MRVQVNCEKLIAAREAQGLSFHGLAMKAGISHVTVVNVETGKRVTTTATLAKICKVLGLRVDDVLEITEDAG